MKQKSIFIFAYYSFKDPVFQSAVLPYFTNFPNKEKFSFILLTFEQKKYRTGEVERREIAVWLKEQNIVWYNVNWHSGRLKPVKKVYDLINGMKRAVFLVKKFKADAIYSEGFPGAVIAHFIARLTRRPHIIHTFEPHTDYMIESGVWKEISWEARTLRRYEELVAKKAFALMTATEGMVNKWKLKTTAEFYRVPSCVDLDHFQFSASDRRNIRARHCIQDHEIVLVYLGKLGGMYMEQELFDFYRTVNELECSHGPLRYMILTTEDKGKVVGLIQQSGLNREAFIIESLRREQVPAYLSAADIAFSGIRPYPSKRFCSPIKNGEYWACGLPVIIPDGISDDYLLAEKYQIGWRLPELTIDAYRRTWERVMRDWDKNRQTSIRKKARDFVAQDRNVKTYQQLYLEVFQNAVRS